MEKIKILVCCHKNDIFIRKDPPYFPIQVGKALRPDINLGFQCDDEGENISLKNSQYCELTALYWGWKNLQDVEYKGLCHYRRYFDCSFKDIDKLIGKSDIIAIYKSRLPATLGGVLTRWTSREDFCIFADTLLSMYPDYRCDFERYFLNSFSFPSCTMFVAKSEVYDRFCRFIFPLFFEMEKKLRPHGYSRLNRNIAYFGEMLLGLFMMHENLKPKWVPMLFEGKRRKDRTLSGNLKYYLLQFLSIFRSKKEVDSILTVSVKKGLENDGIHLTCLKTR